MKKVIALFLLFASLTTSAQDIPRDTLRAVYEREVIYMPDLTHYIKNGRTYKIGAFGKRIKPEFDISPEGSRMFALYQREQKTAAILMTVGLAAVIASPFAAAASPENGPAIYLTGTLGGIALSTVGGVISASARKVFNRALWLRNRDVLVR